MRKILTPKGIQRMKPAPIGQRVDHMDAIVPSFGVRVTDKGGKSYILFTRFPGSKNPTRRMIAQVGRLELAEARETARAWLRMIAVGLDPRDDAENKLREAERTRLEAASRSSLNEVLDRYEVERLTQHRRGAATRRALSGEKGLLTPFLHRDPKSITRSELRQALKKRARESPVSANRQLAYSSAFFNWCRDEDVVEVNPAEKIRKPARESGRERYHSLSELREIWEAAETLGYPFGPYYQLLMVLPMRREEVASISLPELSLGEEAIWTLPGERTKNGQPLRVPLPPLARSIILMAISDQARPKHSAFVFTTTSSAPISGFAKGKRRLDAAIMKMRAKIADDIGGDAEPMNPWVVHDLRTSFATLACDQLRIDPAVCDRCLNHVGSATTSKLMRTYNRAEMFDQRKAALAAWASLLVTDVCTNPSSKVVQLKAASRG